MSPERRKQVLLGILVVALAGAVYQAMLPPAPVPGGGPPPRRSSTSTSAGRQPAQPEAESLDVRLESLTAQWPEPGVESRNLFQFGRARRVGGPEQVAPPPPPPPPPMVTGPPPPPPVPPIPLKLIGVVTQRESTPIAVLNDGRGVYYGKEGDVIEGRYRIHRVTADAVEISHLDGRGRQMMRLGG